MHLLFNILGMPFLYQNGISLLLDVYAVMKIDAVLLMLGDVDGIMFDCLNRHILHAPTPSEGNQQNPNAEYEHHPYCHT